MSKQEKSKPIKPDDYYNDGLFEFVRYGKVVSMKFIGTPEQRNQMQAIYKKDYPKVKQRIDEKVNSIREKISICDPLMLLKFTKDMAMMSNINKFSEINYSQEEIRNIRAQEYIQSVLVSTENHFNGTGTQEEQEELRHSILADVEDLYKEFMQFYHYWSAYKKDTGEISDEMMHYIVESQMLYLVRGNRYQVFQLEPLKRLLPPHNDLLVELFGVTAEEIIEGLEKLEYSMSQGIADAWMDTKKGFDQFCKSIELGVDSETAVEDSRDVMTSVIEKAFGEALNDISHVTGWNANFIGALTYHIGECETFFDGSEFSGWPIMEMPIWKKPFIEINGVSYGFDYNSLFDNIYRALQKEIFRQKPEYKTIWNKQQNSASENMVKELFLNLLPDATAYSSNYYPVSTSTKQMNENDLLIIYENYLFIIEVKAGSFPQTPPLIDFDSHIEAYTNLVQNPTSQCYRTIEYIEGHQPAPFYDINANKKFEIDKFSDYKEVYSFAVTIDDFNEFATKAEKLSFITLASKTIVISYDDLLCYENYFDSPIYFLHFLKQRKLAIDIPQIALNDELDHLGMYIEYNKYSITASDFPEENKVDFFGYREALDNYFCKLYHPKLTPIKPQQDMQSELVEIIQVLEQGKDENRIDVAHFLLDLSGEARDKFINSLHQTIQRQSEIGRMLAMFFCNGTKYCVFIRIPNIKEICINERQDYIYSAILRDERTPIMWINLTYEDNKLFEASGKWCYFKDILTEDLPRLKKKSLEYARSRIDSFQRQHNRKIRVNDRCPCGSGKKYKKCCMKLF